MSEFQHYHFLAADRPLDAAQMAALRQLSTRATITPTSFVNEYHWGDFRGNPGELVERYFDGFCHVTNWGTRELQLRFPPDALDPALVAPYLVDGRLARREAEGRTILTFHVEDDCGFWVIDREPSTWLPTLLPLRDELERGDARALYLAWLAAAQDGVVDAAAPEPPVPPGLDDLSPALTALADLLLLDAYLIAAAAEQSAPLAPERLSEAEVAAWVGGLPEAEKDALLTRAMLEGGEAMARVLRRRYRAARAGSAEAARAPIVARTAGALRAQSDALEAAASALEAAATAADRNARLDALARREASAWTELERAFERPADEARHQAQAALLRDLRDLATRDGRMTGFEVRVSGLRAKFGQAAAFWDLFEAADPTA